MRQRETHESLYLLDPNQWRATVFLVIHNNFADPTALCWGQIIQVSALSAFDGSVLDYHGGDG